MLYPKESGLFTDLYTIYFNLTTCSIRRRLFRDSRDRNPKIMLPKQTLG